ncbi:hypothetical protein F5Y13DRAFT_53967 [Hypoxylon sp. FL1857]|nr:hypothetical protein F5Y13DRAFT_53967 [Hypoxylon sp. FL1857]
MIRYRVSEQPGRRERSTLSPTTDFSFQGIVQSNSADMKVAFQRVIDAFLKHSKLEIDFIRISNVTDDSFLVSLEARTSNTGPAKAVLTPMTIELHSVAGCFGKMTLPEIVAAPNGAPIVVKNQIVEITDKTALQFFVVPAIKRDVAKLSLKNGETSISVPALGTAPRAICYERDIRMQGMDGPQVSIKSVSVSSRPPTPFSLGSNANNLTRANISITLRVKNPSPIEISFGVCEFEIQNSSNEVFAELKGRLDIRNDHFNATFQGIADKRVALAGGEVRLVGRRCVGAGWCDETIKGIDIPIEDDWKLLKALGLEFQKPEEEEEEDDDDDEKPAAKLFRWRGKFWKKGTWI